MKNQGTLFDIDTQMIETFIPQTTDLFMSGLYWLNVIAKDENEIRFPKWAKLIKDARGKPDHLTIAKLKWLWESITKEPGIKNYLGSRLISLDDEWKKIEPFERLPANSHFAIFFKNFQSYGLPVLPFLKEVNPDAEAEILEPLYLRPGKARRLECCDVQTRLEIHPNTLGPVNVEAAALKVEIKDVTIRKGCIDVKVKSLNHAYTTASLRLQPTRRSHGGKIYDHIAYKDGKDLIPLEKIRSDHEKQLWDKMISSE